MRTFFLAGCETGRMRAALGVFRAGQDRRANLATMTGLCGPADTLKLACAPACRLRW